MPDDRKPPLTVAMALPSIDDPLILALIGKLPRAGAAFSRAERANWLRMMVMAFNATYGVEDAIAIGGDTGEPRARLRLVPVDEPAVAIGSKPDGSPPAEKRYVIDQEGFAMCGVKPIAPEDIPAGAVLWDERRPGDRGDLATVLWKGEGCRDPAKLPRLDVRAA